MKRVFMLLLIFLVSCASPFIKKEKLAFNDMVYMKNGEEYHCEILKTQGSNLIILTEEGKRSIPLKKVGSIDLARKREGYNWKTTKDIKDEKLLKALRFNLSEFKGLGYVNIYVEKHLIINKDSTYIYKERYIRGITDEKGRAAGNISKLYRAKNEKLSIDFARTVTSDGKVLQLREIAIEDASIYSRYPSLENMHERKFAMPEVKPGNVLDWEISIKGKFSKDNPYVMDEIIGDRGITAQGEFIIEAPENFEIPYYFSALKEPEVIKKGGEIIYKWKIEKIPPLLREVLSPPPVYIFPRLVAGLKGDWKDIASEYRSLLKKEGNLTPDSAYKYVMKTIKYIDVPISGSNVFPRKISDIEKTKMGNSLEKAYLLYSLIDKNKHNVDLVLVRSKDRGFISINNPSLLQFDGALVKCDSIWYDPSYEIIPPGYIRPQYQAVYGISLTKGAIVKTPLLPPEKEGEITERVVKLTKRGDALIKEKSVFKGQDLLSIRPWKYLTDEEIKKKVESMLGSAFPNAEIKSYSIKHLNDLCDSIVLFTEYTVKNLGTKEGRYMLLKTPGTQYTAYYVGTPERNYPVYLRRASLSRLKIVILPPSKFTIYAIPEKTTFDTPVSSFYASFEKKGRKLIYNDEYTEKMDIIPPERYQDYRECILKMAQIPQKWIVFKK